MRDILDVHTHTLASGHAYNTIRENAAEAVAKGMEVLAVTEHAPLLPGTCPEIYFSNLKVIPPYGYGLHLLKGVELNILNPKGEVDLGEHILKKLDIAIASLHPLVTMPGSVEENTSCYIEAMKNPFVGIIGHPDDVRYPIDYEAFVQAAAEHHVLIELNNSSLRPGGVRGDAVEADRIILPLCAKYKVPIVMNSDAHVDLDVGVHDLAKALVAELDFPEELIVNTDTKKLEPYLIANRAL